MDKIPMTAAGYSTLENELKHRQQVERPRIIQQITDARTHGDLSENAEYHAAKESQSHNEGRIAELEDKLARAEVIEILPFLASASGSPTICHTFFSSVSSSTKVTVAPNLMVSPDSFETSITSARASLSSSSAMRPSLSDCCSLAA